MRYIRCDIEIFHCRDSLLCNKNNIIEDHMQVHLTLITNITLKFALLHRKQACEHMHTQLNTCCSLMTNLLLLFFKCPHLVRKFSFYGFWPCSIIMLQGWMGVHLTLITCIIFNYARLCKNNICIQSYILYATIF